MLGQHSEVPKDFEEHRKYLIPELRKNSSTLAFQGELTGFLCGHSLVKWKLLSNFRSATKHHVFTARFYSWRTKIMVNCVFSGLLRELDKLTLFTNSHKGKLLDWVE